MSSGRRVALVAGMALLGLVVSGPLGAQESADTVTLSLDDALRIAEGANPTFRQAANQLDLNGSQARATWLGQIVPQASVSLLNTSYSGRLTRIGTDFYGNPIPNPEASWRYDSRTQNGLSLSWNIQGKDLITAHRQLDQSRESRSLQVSSAANTLHSDVRRQYFAALRQRVLLDVEEQLVESRVTDLESARRLFELARQTQVDVLNAEVQVEQQRINIQAQRRAYQQALLQLRTTLGDTELGPFRLQDTEPGVFDPSGLDDEDMVARALRESPRIRTSQSSVDGARLSLDDASNWKWPQLQMRYDLTRYVQDRNADAVFDVGYDSQQMQSSFSIGVSLPFFNNYFQNSYQEAQASVQLENERENLKQTRLEVERTVREALINLRNQYESYQVAARSQDIAQQATELAREEYRLGSRTFEQLQQTVAQEATARRTTIDARFSFLDALVSLEAAVGGPVAATGAAGQGS